MHPHLYLSPHPDDVALSCGGRIYDQIQQGKMVLVLTFFAASPPPIHFSSFAEGQHAKWELAVDAMARRRAEDQAALKVLGTEPLYLPYFDCIYRLHPQTGEAMYASEEGIFGEIDPAEYQFHLELARGIEEIAEQAWKNAVLCAPLTAGHHVDHQLIHRAAIALWERGYRIEFYEDHPYAEKDTAREEALASWHGPGALQPLVIPISDRAMAARIEAIACYGSQIRTLYTDLEKMEQRVREYCAALRAGYDIPESNYAERYWVPPDRLPKLGGHELRGLSADHNKGA